MVKKIVLSIAAILFAGAAVFAQNKQVSGTVTGQDGSPVIGATVVVEGTTLGTSTDMQGKYTLAAPANGTLLISFIGYEDAKVAIGGKTTVNVTLKEASKAIDNVIVVAFGEAKKDAFTGSAKVVSSEDLTKTQSSNVSDALVGKVAGMQMSAASGRPGADKSINIRGVGSLYSGTEPLWVVDGMPYEGDINNINPADIESITVQKDAASNALYGARGANGVIMVTTKRAKAGDARVTFDGKWGLNTRALQTYDYVDNAGEYYALHYQALYNNYLLGGASKAEAHLAANELLTSNNPGGLGYNVMTVPAGQTLIGSNGKLNPNATVGRLVTMEDGTQYWLQPDDWLNALYKPSFRQEYNVNVSAAGAKTNFFASFGYLDNDGIIDGSKQERYTTRLRADYQAKKWLKVGGNFAYTHFRWEQGDRSDMEGESDGSVFATALQTAPIYPIYIRNGKGEHIYDKWGFPLYDIGNGANAGMMRTTGGTSNELQDILLNKFTSEGNAFNVNGFAEVRFYRDLKFIFNAGVNIDETRGTSLLNPYYGQFATEGGIISKSHGRDISVNLQQLLNYTHTFGTQHNLDILVGHETYDLKSYGLSASKANMFSYEHDELTGLVVDKQSASSSLAHYNNEGFFARAQYDFDQRVFVSASYRRDASSNFHPKHRWGNFWSASAAWVISREAWFPENKVVDILKLKASYGSQGNDKLGGYTISTYYADMYSISNDGQGGIATIFARKGNENITWETNGNLNVGVEFGLWQNRLYGNVDYFYRKTTDMLFSLSVPASLGYSSYYTNIGDMVNQGVEVELGADLIRRKNFVWSFGVNGTFYRNKITSLPDQYKVHTTHDGKIKGYQSGSSFLAEGESMMQWYIPTYAGVGTEESNKGKATWYAYKTNDDGTKTRYITDDYNVANTTGRELQGDATPDLYGGFNTSFMFYGVDISANFTYQIGGLAYDSGYASLMTSPQKTSVGFAYHRDLWNSWTEDNQNTDIPRFRYDDEYFASTSSRFLMDASYLNIQNITVGYTLPQNITRKFLVEKLRIYFACDNVFYWSQRKGLDPRQSISGSTNPYMYAPVRTFSGGVTITF
ncbi:MAG: TonB-dependent receptor [Rikenellaceae bacterium]|nr:TonB-dependent receptor [Rikenellaceae bacterium]